MRTLPVALITLTLAGGITGGVRARGSGLQQFPAISASIIYDLSDPLKGLSEVSILVESPGSAEEECGIREEALRLAAARPLLDGGIRVVDEPETTTLMYVNANVLSLNQGCAGSVSLSLQEYSRATLIHKNAGPAYVLTRMVVEYENSSELLAGPKFDFGDRIMASLRDQVDRIVTKIKLANQE